MSQPSPIATRAARALAALAIDPAGLKGMSVRARSGPVRTAFESLLPRLTGALRRIPPTVSDVQLFGGLNIAATLAEGRPVSDPGLDQTAAILVIPMAERIAPGVSARLGNILDMSIGHALILLDEGVEAEETVPSSLLGRLAFHTDLNSLSFIQAQFLLPAPADMDHARDRLPSLRIAPGDLSKLTLLATRFGIDNLRVPTLAARAACALAALDRAETVKDTHICEAAELVMPHHARILPEPERDNSAEDRTEADSEISDAEVATSNALPEDILVDAVAALLPPDLLTLDARDKSPKGRTAGGGAGGRRLGNRRGRPLPARSGKPDGRNRIDPIATLRNAAPWQGIRRTQTDETRAVIIYPSDLHIRRFEDRSDRLLIFVVDASGSAAIARLSEAKGAVEILLAQAYVKRDQVALIAFRGTGAELLLPPTRSLVQGKRLLSALPGGGGTPLATGLRAALSLTELSQDRGLSPMLALLTDGRANVSLDGAPGRITAQSDATTLAKHIRQIGIRSVLIDTATRPGTIAATLAGDLGARYLALPRVDAKGISAVVDTALNH
ncbi:magnesium chelatase subunit D [uncultured Roseovarius sp.]|uniref:magnesium chelatase subunit D n=1 Tax=uncultured Roseovarius sp. TaxID=293344 RepID=UPI00261B83E0|nr:magnesium chelatase subunit D [uncultured Roseovarius sp.]